MSSIAMSLLRGVGGDGSGGGEISLVGSLIITKGTSSTYTINDFDSFSEYTVRASNGFSVSRDGETITVTIPSEYENNQAVFFVSRNGSERAFTVGMDSQTLNTPRITSPSNGATNQSTNITLAASNYATVPSGIGSLEESHWQLSLTQTFTDTIRDVKITTGNMQQATFSDLPIGTQLFARVRYRSSDSGLGWSAWSSVINFTTINESIEQPRIFLDQAPFDVNETPVFTSNAFTTVPANSDSHLSSSWRIVMVSPNGDESTVFTRNRSMTDKVRLEVPRGVLETSSEYYAQVKYEGSRIGESMWSERLTFSTATSFVPEEVGTPWEGGYYAGRIMVNGQPKAIVISSRQEGGQATGLQWKTSNTSTTNTDSVVDSYANMQGALAAGINNHPAFKFCYEFRGGGYDDWLLPAKDVWEVVYRNLKPTTDSNNTSSGANANATPPTGNYTSSNPSQTSIAIFRSGGAESFYHSTYYRVWTSTQYSSTGAWAQASDSGYQTSSNKTLSSYRLVRPVRLVDIDV